MIRTFITIGILLFSTQSSSYASRIWIRPQIYIKTINQKVINSCLSYASYQCEIFSFRATGTIGTGCSFEIVLLNQKAVLFFKKKMNQKKIKNLLHFRNLKYIRKYVTVYIFDAKRNYPQSRKKTISRPFYRFSEEIPYIEDLITCTSSEFKTKKAAELVRIISMLSSKEDLVRWEALQLVYRFSYASPTLLSVLQKMKKHEKLIPFKAYTAFLLKRTKHHLQTKQNRWKNIQSLLHHPKSWNRWEGMQRLIIDPSFSKKTVIRTLQSFYKKESKRYEHFQKESYRYPYKTEKSLFYRRLRSQSEEILNFSSGYLHRLTGNPVIIH